MDLAQEIARVFADGTDLSRYREPITKFCQATTSSPRVLGWEIGIDRERRLVYLGTIEEEDEADGVHNGVYVPALDQGFIFMARNEIRIERDYPEAPIDFHTWFKHGFPGFEHPSIFTRVLPDAKHLLSLTNGTKAAVVPG